ncbi:DUF3566 domain-containing protein [Kribbella sp. NPDC050124]|uniref:DUF3566 domain-containing protein n=1 Tax=Kribbella sp. NPDC050124 TaxID=3364114 RepID=UPI0037A38CCA
MTNRARPTWPDGAADSSKTQRPSQGGKQSTAPANPASNGRSTAASGNGQPRSADYRPSGGAQPRPGQSGASPSGPTGQPGAGQPGAGQSQSGRPGTTQSGPVRPPQQPPVRPTSRPANPGPSTPGRPEPWSAPGAGAPGAGAPAAGASSYGVTAKDGAKPGGLGDRVSAARQAVLDKAAAVKDAKPEKAEHRAAVKTQKVPKTSSRPQTRKARLRMSRIDPWSVMKTSFLLAIAFGIVTWVAVFIVWSAIGAAGVFDNINNTVTEVLGTPAAEPFRIENYINTGKVMGFTTLLACADVLIITALATLGSFLYNIAATLLGGLEVTLASED